MYFRYKGQFMYDFMRLVSDMNSTVQVSAGSG